MFKYKISIIYIYIYWKPGKTEHEDHCCMGEVGSWDKWGNSVDNILLRKTIVSEIHYVCNTFVDKFKVKMLQSITTLNKLQLFGFLTNIIKKI